MSEHAPDVPGKGFTNMRTTLSLIQVASDLEFMLSMITEVRDWYLAKKNRADSHAALIYHFWAENCVPDQQSLEKALAEDRAWSALKTLTHIFECPPNELSRIFQTIQSRWGPEAVDILSKMPLSIHQVRRIQQISAQVKTMDKAFDIANAQVFTRLTKRVQGRRKYGEIYVAKDWERADFHRGPKGILDSDWGKLGLRLGRFNIVERRFRTEDIHNELLKTIAPDAISIETVATAAHQQETPAASKSYPTLTRRPRLQSVRRTRLRSKRVGLSTLSCRCTSDVTKAFKDAVDTVKTRVWPEETCHTVYCEWKKFKGVCYMHTRSLAVRFGLKVSELRYNELVKILEMINQGWNSLAAIKTDPKTYILFCKSHRPSQLADDHGVYRFPSLPSEKFSFNQDCGLSNVGIGYDAIDQWDKEGSIHLKSLFSWWWSEKIDTPAGKWCLGDLLDTEFEMYDYHLEDVGRAHNKGWLRNAVYSITQQIIRQDPVYYATYCALRPDKKWRLVSYPYYAKFAKPGDQTSFRHLDISIEDMLLSGRGANMIQGSVSLDDELPGEATEILPGFHKIAGEWWDEIGKDPQTKRGVVMRFEDRHWTQAHKERFGLDWKSVLCQQGDVRITHPAIPHGSGGPCTQVRRTVLPWYVAVRSDHEHLEVEAGGTWSQLQEAHQNMTAPPATPSGLPNMYGAIEYRFPAAVAVLPVGHLSQALCCLKKWTDPAVLAERDIILGSDKQCFDV
ncbi:MAG: hypothetical protein M1814_004656 [Vezdaea aestivalis]|nr:MAG: hypothetical protein M1814_004656 [Vezdaea aestivalis]